jgi:hypothetical protein
MILPLQQEAGIIVLNMVNREMKDFVVTDKPDTGPG